ncbi:ATP-dependent helicase/nuclease subunit A [Gossypium australe]|uniref:ATP-dependent helicase/nuclease subunit A n=1 Tax=Gossypium australe TaxID=47621 RepID=A0A5B6WXS1_9ROSI|nr:ATP-dependent helicase/nuclease subunit A [Gossypium australe]
MSVERSFEAWEEVQRHGQDLADRLAQCFTGLIQSHMIPPSFPWPNPPKSKPFDLEFPSQSFGNKDFGLPIDNSAIFDIGDIGNRIGQVGADFGAGLNGLVQQFFRRLPIPFRAEESAVVSVRGDMSVKGQKAEVGVNDMEGLVGFSDSKDFGLVGNESHSEGVGVEEIPGFNLKSAGLLGRPQGIINITSTFESRTRDLESSLVARGDLWRVEASNANSTSRNDNSLFLIQLGPVLFVRDTTLLLPVHLSKQHLLWYGYDRKNGMHSLCPAVWSKHRRWLLMSMLCLNPLACSFVDLQFPNGQLTYVSGEGLTTSAFLPLCGGLLQAQGQYPGEMRYSFSCKVFTILFATSMISLCPTFGGSNPGLRAEVIHTVKDNLNLICGCSLVAHPSAFASISLGRSKWNGNVGNSGIVVRVDTPLSSVGRPSFSVQINKEGPL